MILSTIAAIIGAYLFYKFDPMKRLLDYCWGAHYVVKYHDILGDEHSIHVFTKDPREAAIIAQIIQVHAAAIHAEIDQNKKSDA